MKIICAMVARFAELAPGGELHVLGGDIDTVRVSSDFPATLTLPLYYVAKAIVPPAEVRYVYPLRVELTGPDGTLIRSADHDVPRPPERAGRDPRVSIVVTMVQLTLKEPGEYTFRFLVDGVEEARTPMHVTRAEEGQPNAEDR